MKPSRFLFDQTADLLAADTASLAAVAAMHVHLAAAAFVPGLDLDILTLVEATFTGSAAKNAGTGTQTVFYDVLTGLLTITLLEPVGGWTWECTVAPGAPETIYGIYVTDNANAVLIGSLLFDQAVTIDDAGQGLHQGSITLEFSPNFPT